MLPRLRSSAKKAIELLERSVSSSKHSLKQANKTPGYVRSQHKVELPPDAKATPAAMPKPPSPSTGASSSASSSSSVFSSWQFRPSIPRDVRLLGAGALSALGAGAVLYSLSGNADGGGDDTQKRSNGEAGMPYFNRISEQIKFKKQLNSQPGVITVLVGPLSCGKTRFLKELAGQFEADETAPPFLYINSRMTPVRTPQEVAKALVNALAVGKIQRIEKNLGRDRFIDLLSSMGIKVKWSGSLPFFGRLDAELAKELKKDEEDFNLTIKKCGKIFEAFKSLPRKPVLVIDEANMLMKWTEQGSSQQKVPSQPQLESLLAFLVAISKEANLVHVYLATSDYFLANWLIGKGLAVGNFEIEVLGDLTEEEAREFFLGDGGKGTWAGIINDPSEPKPVPSGAEEKWPAIYERCGGNIGMLNQCVRAARSKGKWDDALDIVVANSLAAIEQGLDPEIIPKRDELPDWYEDQWETVLQKIIKAPHHAVIREELAKDLGKGDGKSGNKILLSMVKCNLLALRPYSTLARDVPREVYGDLKKEVVTLPSPGHVWAANRILLRRKSDADKAAVSRQPVGFSLRESLSVQS